MRTWRPPRLLLSIARATVAITIAVVLILINSELILQPLALLLVVIVGESGNSLGACARAIVHGIAGISGGVVLFTILAQLGHQPAAQGILFAVGVYLAALVRFDGNKWISFYLLGILFSFQGIYQTIVPPTGTNNLSFSSASLASYVETYFWGLAIALFANALVWPVSAEYECRELLVTSLQHLSILAHLTCKTHDKSIDLGEAEVRDLLVNSIRADYAALTVRLEEVSYEVLWTRWSMRDFELIIQRVRGLQQALITASSALDSIDTLDPQGINVKQHLLSKDRAISTFQEFRRGIDMSIAEVIEEIAVAPSSSLLAPATPGRPTRSPSVTEGDIERQDSDRPLPRRVGTVVSIYEVASISARLRREVQRSDDRHQSLRDSTPRGDRRSTSTARPVDRVEEPESDTITFFKDAWSSFSREQTEAIIRLIKDGALQVEDVLLIEAGMPSLQTLYSEKLPKAWTSSLVSMTPLGRRRARAATILEETVESNPKENFSGDAPCSEALTKSYSLLFGLGQLTHELCELHSIVKRPRKTRIRFHLLGGWFKRQSTEDPMTLQAALAALAGVGYTAPSVPLFTRVARVERWFWGDRSTYAAKVAFGASVYTILLLAPAIQPFFIQYGMTSSLITVIVAISPTLGQSLRTFLLQMLGTGAGSLFGLVTLEIFKGRGGYTYNPFGLTVFLMLWGIFSSFVFYYREMRYRIAGLLLMNGASTVVFFEYFLPVGEVLPPGPPRRTAYAIASMCVSIVIAGSFQVLFFRTPARRKLRLDIAAVTFGLSSYNTLLQSYINAVAPADETPTPPAEALATIQSELIKRETKLQAQIIALSAVYEFAAVEPQFALPFKGDVILKVIKSHQVILDRFREARTALGTTGFNERIHKDFISKLYPYRIHSQRLARTLFYLSATSLLSKTPLPRDVPSSRSTWASFENDVLVLSRRLSQHARGEEELHSNGFLRYWLYLASIHSVSSELEDLEVLLGELFGVPEDTNPNLS